MAVTTDDDAKTTGSPKKTAKSRSATRKTRRKKSSAGAAESRDGNATPATQVDVADVAPPNEQSPPSNTRAKSGRKSTKKKRATRSKAAQRSDAQGAETAAASEQPAKSGQSRSRGKSRKTTRIGAVKRAGTAKVEERAPSAQPGQAAAREEPARGKGRAGKPRVKSKADASVSRASDAEKRVAKGQVKRSRSSGKKKTAKAAPDASNIEFAESTGPEDEDKTGKSGKRLMLINVSAGDECRIAVRHEGRLEELFIERSSAQSHLGNIYKGRVTNVEPSIQAVFVDFGLQKNGFLHISDVQPQYFPDHDGVLEEVGRKIPRHARPPIQKCFRRGQEVIVQVIKEGVGTKGPTLTTYLSIPGRFLVMMPGMCKQGVTRRIEDEDIRREARALLGELSLPSDMGFILRTAGIGRAKRELQRDLNYLLRMWKNVVARVKNSDAPAEAYQESDLVTRTIRDVYTSDFERLIVDDAETAKKAREFLQIAMPRSKAVVEVYSEMEPLFHRWGIEEEIERMNSRHVPLPSGGSLVIDSTEALVAIDVNSGKYRANDDAEETAFRTNMEAAEEIAHQLRLRDLGGLIVCDFIDMRADRHQRSVERALRDALKKHKERAKILRMSAFGLIEMTRQRQGPSIRRNIYFECRHCGGAGLVKMPESVILDVMRMIHLAVHREEVRRVAITVSSDVAYEILNRKRSVLAQIENETDKTLVVQGDASFRSDQIECVCEDAQGHPVALNTGRSNGNGR